MTDTIELYIKRKPTTNEAINIANKLAISITLNEMGIDTIAVGGLIFSLESIRRDLRRKGVFIPRA